jgi:hypothetical protein
LIDNPFGLFVRGYNRPLRKRMRYDLSLEFPLGSDGGHDIVAVNGDLPWSVGQWLMENLFRLHGILFKPIKLCNFDFHKPGWVADENLVVFKEADKCDDIRAMTSVQFTTKDCMPIAMIGLPFARDEKTDFADSWEQDRYDRHDPL